MKQIYLSISASVLTFTFALTANGQNTPPVVTSQIADFTAYAGAAAQPVDLAAAFADTDVSAAVRFSTSLGSIDLALFGQQKPITVANFLNYVNSGRYFVFDPTANQLASSFIHVSVPGTPGNIIQGGGFIGTVNPSSPPSLLVTQVLAFPSIQNEPGISNQRGTISMAKISGQPNSATSQWFINLADNGGPPNNYDTNNGGYTVFGRVVNNTMSTVDAISALPRYNAGGPFGSIPLRNYTPPNTIVVGNLVSIPGISQFSPLTFAVSSSAPSIADATLSGTKLLVSAHAVGDATFTVTATDFDGAPVSQNFTVHVLAAPGRLVQLSTRMQIGNGANVLIGGFIMRGPSPKRLMIRGIGPSTGLPGALEDPVLELHDSTGAIVATNNNWGEAANNQDITDTGIAPTSPNEAAILTTLPSDPSYASYTAVVQGNNNTTGIGLVEVYDLDSGPGSTLLNISTRGHVDIDPNALIGGFFLGGTESKRILVRAIGPSLSGAGISDALADPVLELRDANAALIQSNDDWGSSPNQAEIQASGLAPTNPKESAVVQMLSAAPYTAIVRGVNNTTGVGSVEIYQLP